MGQSVRSGQRRNIYFYARLEIEGENQHQMMKDKASAPPQQPHKMGPPPGSQHHMVQMPPHHYSQTMPGPVPLPGPKGAISVMEFGTEPVQLSCYNCHRQIVTDVTSGISSSGWCFALTCCLFGSWLASLLVKCLPGFRRFTHLCPLCRALISEAEPKHSGKHIALIIFASILALAVVGFLIASRIIRVSNYY